MIGDHHYVRVTVLGRMRTTALEAEAGGSKFTSFLGYIQSEFKASLVNLATPYLKIISKKRPGVTIQ